MPVVTEEQLAYFPFPYTQRIRAPIDCSGALLLIELSGKLFSTWACAFSQYIGIPDHTTLFSLFLDVIERCCEICASFVLETVRIFYFYGARRNGYVCALFTVRVHSSSPGT